MKDPSKWAVLKLKWFKQLNIVRRRRIFQHPRRGIETDTSELISFYYPSSEFLTDLKCFNKDNEIKESIYATGIPIYDRQFKINLNDASRVDSTKLYIVGGSSPSMHTVQLTDTNGLPGNTSTNNGDSFVEISQKNSLSTKDIITSPPIPARKNDRYGKLNPSCWTIVKTSRDPRRPGHPSMWLSLSISAFPSHNSGDETFYNRCPNAHQHWCRAPWREERLAFCWLVHTMVVNELH